MKMIHCKKTIPALLTALALTCLCSVTADAGRGDTPQASTIVGFWHVQYSGDLVFESFDQWHRDGLEYEVANLFGVSCQGVWKSAANGTVQLFHSGWLFDATGALVGYFNETQINTVIHDGQTYHGTWHEKDYDVDGNFLSEETGTLTATRLTVNTPP